MANFPTSVSTNSNLYIAVNGLQTTLASSITNSQTTITLTSTSGFPTTGYVTIENNEVVLYTGISGADLTGCTRGADGTTALAHSTGVTVGLTIVAAHHNLLKDEIIAVETALQAGFARGNISAGSSKITVTGGTNAIIGSGVTVDFGTVTLDDLSDVVITTPTTSDILRYNGTNWVNFPSTSSATASTAVLRDSNANIKTNEMIENFSTTVTAAGTTTLTAASSPLQQFTGTTTQTVKLPNATTLTVGHYFTILNRSTGNVTVQNNGAVALLTISANSQTTFIVTDVSTSNGVWDASTSSGGSAVVQYVRYIVGTASGSYTGSTTVFDLPFAYVQDGKSLNVFYNGQLLSAANYSENTSTEVTMGTALVTGSEVVFKTISSGANATAVTFLREDYIVGTPSGSYTGSTTVFNLTSTYTPGGNNLLVTLDGDVQTKGATIDYVESNASTVTFNNALVSGQKVSFLFSQSAAPAGTVSNGTAGQLAVYASTGVVVSGFGQAAVQATTASGSSTTSSTFQNTALTASITPTSSSSRIKVTVTFVGSADASGDNAYFTIKRGSMNLGGTNGFVAINSTVTGLTTIVTPVAITYIDSPATTSSTTYTVAMASANNTSTVEFMPAGSQKAVIILEEII